MLKGGWEAARVGSGAGGCGRIGGVARFELVARFKLGTLLYAREPEGLTC